jgi:hypothetical protein
MDRWYSKSPCSPLPSAHLLLPPSLLLLLPLLHAPLAHLRPVAFSIRLGTHIGRTEGTAAHAPQIFKIPALPAPILSSPHLRHVLRLQARLAPIQPVAFSVPFATHIDLTERAAAHAPLTIEIPAHPAFMCSCAQLLLVHLLPAPLAPSAPWPSQCHPPRTSAGPNEPQPMHG